MRSASERASCWSWVTNSALGARAAQDVRHLLAQAGAQAGIEGRERLVQQDHGRFDGEGPRQGHPLPLAAGQLVGVGRSAIGQADQGQALLDPAGTGLAEADVGGHGQVGEQRSVLEHHADPPALWLDPGTSARHGLPADRHRARVRSLETGHETEQGGLAGAARAEERHDLTLGHDHGGLVDRLRPAERLRHAHGSDGVVPGGLHIGLHVGRHGHFLAGYSQRVREGLLNTWH